MLPFHFWGLIKLSTKPELESVESINSFRQNSETIIIDWHQISQHYPLQWHPSPNGGILSKKYIPW